MARPLRLLVALLVVGVLAACSGPGGGPPASEPTQAVDDVAPTRGTGGVEKPLPQGQALPVLTTAVAGTGSGTLVAPDTVCVFWTWGSGDLPALTDGLTFSIDHADVVPQTWTASHAACGDSGGGVQWCDGAQITVDTSTCVLGFVRSASPAAQALVGMVGTLTCTLSADECATLTQQIDDAPDVSPDLDLEAVAGSGT